MWAMIPSVCGNNASCAIPAGERMKEFFVAPTLGERCGGWVADHCPFATESRKQATTQLPGEGWIRQDAVDLLSYNYTNHGNITITLDSVDTVVCRIPHGWIQLNEITREALQDSVDLAHELFGTRSVIIMSLPIGNNVATPEQLH